MRKIVHPLAFLLVAAVAACGGASKPTARPVAQAAAPDLHAQNRSASVAIVWTMANEAGEKKTLLTTGFAINARAVASSAPFGSGGLKLESAIVLVVDVGAKVRPVKATMLGMNDKLDVVVFQTEADMPASVTLQPAAPSVGEAAYTIDMQVMNDGTTILPDSYHRAVVSYVDAEESALQSLTIDVGSVTPFSTGCGLFNARGELIGLVSRPLLMNQPSGSRAIVLPAKHLVAFMRSSEVSMTVALPAKP